jgi:hypothetical protein
LDFEKAFDTVKWSYMQRVLETMNVGPKFRRWISIIYKDITSCCMNNGYTTEYFHLSRGIRQGCPISALLFLLIVETLATNIRADEQVKGIIVNETEIKISQLADDTTLFLKNEKSLQKVLTILDYFYTCSGLKLNKSKTEIFYLGNTNHKPNVTNLGIKVAELSFKSLGIHFSKDLKQTSEKNLEDRFNKFKTILNIWKSRGLSLKGKVTVLKSVAIPQLLYATSVLYVPDDFITKVDMAISKFIWNDKPPKIKKSTMISRIHEGGLKMPSFEFMVYSQKVMWIKRILSSDQQKWKSIAFKLIGLSEFDLKCKPSVEFIQNKQSVFYEQVLRIWLNFHARNPSKDNICKEIIWNNKFILIDKKIVNTNYIRWKQHGILYVKNLLHDDGTFLDMFELSQKYGLPFRLYEI